MYDYMTENTHSTKKKTQEEAVANLIAKFPNLDFSRFVYVNSKTPGIYVCPEHGEKQKSYNRLILSLHGCESCAGVGKSCKKDTEGFLKELERKFGVEVLSRYDFSGMVYTGANDLIQVGC